MQHGAVSVLWRQISQCQRLEVVRTASQRNSYFGGIAPRLLLSAGHYTKLGLRAAAPSLPLPRGLGRGRPLASKLAVCLTSGLGNGDLRLAVVQLGPTESMVCHFGRWLAGGQVLV